MFAILFGVIVANAYFMYRFQWRDDETEGMLSYVQFMDNLVSTLIPTIQEDEARVLRSGGTMQDKEEDLDEGISAPFFTFLLLTVLCFRNSHYSAIIGTALIL
jgi:hypothetical protein